MVLLVLWYLMITTLFKTPLPIHVAAIIMDMADEMFKEECAWLWYSTGCFACGMDADPYVADDNGHAYCLHCLRGAGLDHEDVSRFVHQGTICCNCKKRDRLKWYVWHDGVAEWGRPVCLPCAKILNCSLPLAKILICKQ